MMLLDLFEEICLGEGHCINTRSAAALSIYCYIVALAYTVSVSIRRARLGEHGHATHLMPVKPMRWFPTFLGFAYVCRIAWMVLSNLHFFEWVHGYTPPYSYSHMIINVPILPTRIDVYVLGVISFGKLATLLYFSAFTLLLRFWEDVLSQAKSASRPLARFAANQSVIADYTRKNKHQSRARRSLVVVNVWLYLMEFALLAVKTFFPGYDSAVFKFEYAFIALFFFFLAFMLARSALHLRRVLRKIEFSPLAAALARRIVVLGSIVSLLFLYRSILLVISTPGLEVFDPHASNPWLFYTIPEILPGSLVIAMMSIKRQSSKTSQANQNRYCLSLFSWCRAPVDSEATPLLTRHRQLSIDDSPFVGQELHI